MAEQKQSWITGACVYQVYIRSFQDSNADGCGDLRGIINRLDYISELGVTGLWITPFFKSPMVDFGYDVSDYYDVDPDYGNKQDFKELLDKAHARNIKVIVDLVFSHTSEQHNWFQQSLKNEDNKYNDYYVWADPKNGQAPNNWLSIFGGSAWQYSEKRQQYYLHNFLKEQPDLNLHNPDVQDELFNIAKHWLELGVDGFRLDACNCYFHDLQLRSNPMSMERRSLVQDEDNPYFQQIHIHDTSQPENLEFLKRFRKLIDNYDDRILVGEIFCDEEESSTALAYTANGYPLHSAYNFSLLQNHRRGDLLRENITKHYLISTNTAWAFSNHDVSRVVTRWPDQLPVDVRAKGYLNLLLNLPGLSFLYQGEELGLEDGFLSHDSRLDPFGARVDSGYQGRDGCRTPMPWTRDLQKNCGFTEGQPWLPLDQQSSFKNVEDQLKLPSSTLNMTKRLLKFRATEAAIKYGDIHFWMDTEHLVGFTRSYEHSTYLIVSSFSTQTEQIKHIEPEEILTELSEGCHLASKKHIEIDPGGYGVIKLRSANE